MSPAATAAYLRVSTHQQDWKLQRDAIARACRARGDRIAKAFWFEEKKSGRSIDRPVLKKLRAAVRAGRVGRLYVFRIDRLTRSGIRDTLALVEEFRRGERIRAARARIEAKGGAWGRPRVVDRATIARAQKLRGEGRTLRAISIALKVKRSTLCDALSAAASAARSTAAAPARAAARAPAPARAPAAPARARKKAERPRAKRVPSRPTPKTKRRRARSTRRSEK